MIGSLRGLVIDRELASDRSAGAEITLEVAGGVGYRVVVTSSTLSKLPSDEPVLLFTHHHVRETEEKLFGFAEKEERVAFEALITANGVGPALALAILAAYPPAALSRIMADEDVAALCEVSGVGKKTAQRLLVDLQSKLVLPVLDEASGVAIDLSGANGDGGANGARSGLTDVREALVNLGYSSDEIRKAVAAVADEASEADSGQLLKQAILALSRD